MDFYIVLKRLFVAGCFCCAFSFVAADVEAQTRAPRSQLSAREIAARVMPSVLLIVTEDSEGRPLAQGSAFVFRPGLAVTNLHVFTRASSAKVTNVATGTTRRISEIVGVHVEQDLCVFRVDERAFPPVSLGNSHAVRTGDEIYVASNPKGLEGSFTRGIISAIRDQNRVPEKEVPLDALERLVLGDQDRTLFQLDAAISSGSSGGVVVNSKGQAIGIVKSSLTSGQNLNFAIPVEQLKRLPHRFKEGVQFAGACAYSNREQDNLAGPVKKVVEKSRHERIVDGRLIDDGILIDSVQVYSTSGLLTESHIYDAVSGRYAGKYLYYYDDSGLKTKYVFVSAANGQEYPTNFDLADGIYNKLYGRKFSGRVGKPDQPSGQQVFDASGNMTEWLLGGVTIRYSFDAKGRPTESMQIKDGQIQIRKKFRYTNDLYGNWIEKKEISNFPNVEDFGPNRWIDGKTTIRDIEYYDPR